MSECLPCQKAKEALQKGINIVEGYTNLILNLNEEEANRRKLICLDCPFKKELVKVKDIQYYSCSLCNCPIDAKTRSSNESCANKDNPKW